MSSHEFDNPTPKISFSELTLMSPGASTFMPEDCLASNEEMRALGFKDVALKAVIIARSDEGKSEEFWLLDRGEDAGGFEVLADCDPKKVNARISERYCLIAESEVERIYEASQAVNSGYSPRNWAPLRSRQKLYIGTNHQRQAAKVIAIAQPDEHFCIEVNKANKPEVTNLSVEGETVVRFAVPVNSKS